MKLALGTAQFGLDYGIANNTGHVSQPEARLILDYAEACGMDTLDTAVAYGNSEAVLGELGVQHWRVVTKLPAVPENCSNIRDWVERQVSESLDRLGKDRLHGLMLHRPGQLLEKWASDLFPALQEQRSAGLTSKIGISVYGVEELEVLFDTFDFDIVQAPLNIFDQNLVRSGWAEKLKRSRVELHVRSPFLQGLLLMPRHKRPAKFDRWRPVWQIWDEWLLGTGLSPLQACLRYASSLDVVDRIVVGVDSVAQLTEIVAAAHGELPSLPPFEPLDDPRLINPSRWNEL